MKIVYTLFQKKIIGRPRPKILFPFYKQQMKALDLFSGTGGIPYALRGLGIVPLAYCERDPNAIAVLRQRMRTGDLPPAPIHTDISKFPGKDYRGKVDLVAAGFPCTGFSSLGGQDGFDNPGTGLYRYVVRIIDEAQPTFVFLENIATIRTNGLCFVAETLRSRGYVVSWVSLKAFNVGSPQHRPRWFCLAVREGTKLLTLRQRPGSFVPFNWKREPTRRLIENNAGVRRRLELLGNAVVPDCVRAAFLYLWTGSSMSVWDVLTKATTWTLALPTRPATEPKLTEQPFHGMAWAKNRMAALPAPKGLKQLTQQHQITLDGSAYVWNGPRNPSQTLDKITTKLTLQCWATPRRSCPLAARILTNRTAHDLPSQMRFEIDTPAEHRDGHPNPRFVEWLMGFPRDWTKVD